jgi:UDP-N-acetyl-D-mannosaminuronic acid dehydrogenase
MSKVSVIGLGYMGLPMAAILAKAGHEVVGVDISTAVVERVNKGECPFVEPGMAELVKEAHASGRLRAVTAPEKCEIYILSLPTPVDHVTHAADMSFVENASRTLASVLEGGELVVLESTSPIGATVASCKAVIEKANPGVAGKVDYVFCPERAIPGSTLKEMVGNDRLIGGLTPQATARAKALYKSFCTGELLEASTQEAEMVKLVENASRDVQIAFANELSLVCDKLGLDVWRVIALANHHPRVNILRPGPGVGGHCIAVDPWFIINAAPEQTPLMQAARYVNDRKPAKVADDVKRLAGGKAVVACLGLAYKPDVDDLRESPSIAVVERLAADPNLELKVVEPHLQQWQMPLVGLEEAVAAADVVVTLTGHKAFQGLRAGALQGKKVLDVAGIWLGRDDV